MDTIYKPARYQIIPAYIGALRSKTGYYLGYVPNEYADQVTADNAYDMLKNDISINHPLHIHACMAGGEQWEIEAKIPYKFILEKMLARIFDFVHARKSLIENGMLFGLGVQRKYYDKFKISECPGIEWIGISSIKEVDRRRLRLERNEDSGQFGVYRNEMYWTIWSPMGDQYICLEDRHDNPAASDGGGLQDYIWYYHEQEEQSPYFRGLGQVLYPYAYIHKCGLQYWADLCESWSKPFIAIFTDLTKGTINALLSGDIKTAEEKARILLETCEGIRARHTAVLDKGDTFEVKEHGSTGNNIIKDLMDYCDDKIKLLFLGAELTTGTGSGVGSYALGNVHRQQTETLIMYSRSRLQEVLLRDIIYDLLYRNRINFYRLGFAAPEIGDIKFRIYTEAEEQKKEAINKGLTGYHGDMQKVI